MDTIFYRYNIIDVKHLRKGKRDHSKWSECSTKDSENMLTYKHPQKSTLNNPLGAWTGWRKPLCVFKGNFQEGPNRVNLPGGIPESDSGLDFHAASGNPESDSGSPRWIHRHCLLTLSLDPAMSPRCVSELDLARFTQRPPVPPISVPCDVTTHGSGERRQIQKRKQTLYIQYTVIL